MPTFFSPISKDKEAAFDDDKKAKLPWYTEDIDVLIATDCISEGQNLQDCDELINYDIHWNPVRIIQRFGRIDRIGSRNKQIQLVNYWPDMELDKYIKLKGRVESRMDDIKPGTIFILKNRNNAVNIDRKNLLHPFYMVYLKDDGEVICDHLHPKHLLDIMRLLCKDKKDYDRELCAQLNKETSDGRHMEHYSNLLQKAIDSIVKIKEESDIDRRTAN